MHQRVMDKMSWVFRKKKEEFFSEGSEKLHGKIGMRLVTKVQIKYGVGDYNKGKNMKIFLFNDLNRAMK